MPRASLAPSTPAARLCPACSTEASAAATAASTGGATRRSTSSAVEALPCAREAIGGERQSQRSEPAAARRTPCAARAAPARRAQPPGTRRPRPRRMGLAALTFTLVSTLPAAGAQYLKDSAKFTQAMTVGDGVLAEQIQSHEDLVEDFFPGRSFEDLSVYVYDPPPVVDYSVGMIVEPCSNAMLEADCCVGLYGAGEYGVLQVELEDYRQRPKNVLADSSEILANTLPVTEQGVELPIEESRRADDELYIDSECTGVGAPHPYCRGYRMAMRSFYEQAACTDHNMTVDAGKDCTDIFGNTKPNCMQVAYTQTGFIMVCGDSEDETDTFSDDDHCGTYLEIHRANGSPYDPEEKVLGDAKIDDRDATGYNTTTMDLFYEDEGRVLCAYDENEIRVDSMVFVLESSPTCCCPMVFQATSGTGHFMCPQNLYKKDHGPFGEKIDTYAERMANDEDIDAYPYCPWVPEDTDLMACGGNLKGTVDTGPRGYTYPCPHVEVNNQTELYTSRDIAGHYGAVCPYFESCGLGDGSLYSAPSNNEDYQSVCMSKQDILDKDYGGVDPKDGTVNGDSEFSFKGRVGKVVRVPTAAEFLALGTGALYDVTFNDGRTFYSLRGEDLKLEALASNYEVWWVQRTRYNYIVRKKKGFRVQQPKCTFDSANDRYFPYAIAKEGGGYEDTV